jgi:adenylyltransferase/sulfurtransferase
LLLYDAWSMRFRELKIRRDPECPVCGDRPSIRELIDYEQFCGVTPQPGASASASAGVEETTVEQLKARLDAGLPTFVLDVREPHEYQICRIPNSTLIPLGQLGTRLSELPNDGREIVVHCKMGGRSAKAVKLLKDQGVDAKNLTGGVLAWIDRVDPSQAKY